MFSVDQGEFFIKKENKDAKVGYSPISSELQAINVDEPETTLFPVPDSNDLEAGRLQITKGTSKSVKSKVVKSIEAPSEEAVVRYSNSDSSCDAISQEQSKPRFGYDEVDTAYYTFPKQQSTSTGNFVKPDSDSLRKPTGESVSMKKDINYDFSDEEIYDDIGRGTIDVGILFLRVGIAIVLIYKSLQWFFRVWDGSGISGLQSYLERPTVAFNSHYTAILSWVFPIIFLLAGLAIFVGVFTPLAAALALSVQLLLIVSQIVDQHSIGVFDDPHITITSTQFPLFIALALMTLLLLGPGTISFDRSRGWARRPFIGSIIAVIFGIGMAIVIWSICNGHDPVSALW